MSNCAQRRKDAKTYAKRLSEGVSFRNPLGQKDLEMSQSIIQLLYVLPVRTKRMGKAK